jgi:hypothetical protein
MYSPTSGVRVPQVEYHCRNVMNAEVSQVLIERTKFVVFGPIG